MNDFLRSALTIAAKDLRSEFRNKEAMNAAWSFALVVLLLFSLAFEPAGNPDVRDMSGGLLWIVYLFAGILILNRSFARETEGGCLDALIAAPISGSELFLGKVLSNGLLLLILELLSLPIFGIFYDVDWTRSFGSLFLVFVLGTWGLTVVGTMFSAITASNRLRELMLPLLVFPVTLPVMMASVKLTTLILVGEPLGDSVIWLKLLFGFALIFSLLGAVLLDVVLRE